MAHIYWAVFHHPGTRPLHQQSTLNAFPTSHKPNASVDFLKSLVIESEKSTDPLERDVYLLGTPEGAEKLEFFITSTIFLP